MEGTFIDGTVHVGADAKQRFHDARGYGRMRDGKEVELAPVEAAHLLARGDLEEIIIDTSSHSDDAPSTSQIHPGLDTVDSDTSEIYSTDDSSTYHVGFRGFLIYTGMARQFAVYKDLRDRGFYLSPARPSWPGVDSATDNQSDFIVYPRGMGPYDGEIAHRIRVIGEREKVKISTLGNIVLAVVDEDGELTYFETNSGSAFHDLISQEVNESDSDDGGINKIANEPTAQDQSSLPTDVSVDVVNDRVVCYDATTSLYEQNFYGQRLFGRNADTGPLQFSLIEAAYLAQQGVIAVDTATLVAIGRDVEGDRFDQRLRVYAALRHHHTVPKSGFKFGADFRVYTTFEEIDSLDHSTDLVRVCQTNMKIYPRDLSLDIRLAGGVRKRMVFALTPANGDIHWLSVARLTL
jgi:tRNA intron endonuclease